MCANWLLLEDKNLQAGFFKKMLRRLSVDAILSFFLDDERERPSVAHKILSRFSPRERLEGLSTDERLEGLSTNDRLEGLSPEEIKSYLEQIEGK